MCNSFSGIIRENGDVIWYFGVDSHEDILDRYNSQAQIKLEDYGYYKRDWARFEVTPKSVSMFPNSNVPSVTYFDYFNSQEPVFQAMAKNDWEADLDEPAEPIWFTKIHGDAIWKAHKIWLSKLKPYLNVQNYNLIKPTTPVWTEQDQQASLRFASLVLDICNKQSRNIFSWDDVLGHYEGELNELVGKAIVKQTLSRFKSFSVPEESLIALTLDCFNLPESFWPIFQFGYHIVTEYPLKDFLYLIRRGYYVLTSSFDSFVKVGLFKESSWLFDSSPNQDCKPEEV